MRFMTQFRLRFGIHNGWQELLPMSLHCLEMHTHTGCLCEALAPTVDRYDPGTIVAKLLADALASFGVAQTL